MPENNIISKTFTYDLPDAYLHQTNTLGKTGTWTYTGPDKLWIYVNDETNKINSNFHYTERDNGADVPNDPGLTKVLVDANQNPLLASLIYNEVDYSTLDRDYETLPDGTEYWCPNPTPPDHTYELIEIEYDPATGEFKKPYPWKKPHMSWEELKHVRTMLLKTSDGKVRTASPDKVPLWEEYRQKLRDLPVTFAGIDPWKVPFPQEPTE